MNRSALSAASPRVDVTRVTAAGSRSVRAEMIQAVGEESWKHRSKDDDGSAEPEQHDGKAPASSWRKRVSVFRRHDRSK